LNGRASSRKTRACVYGLVGYKIHAKVALVVRREGEKIRRYVHLGQQLQSTTARLYTDLSLFTCRPEFGEDPPTCSTS